MAYAAYCSRPDIAYACAILSRSNHTPTKRADRLIRHAVQYTAQHSDRGIMISTPKRDTPLKFDIYLDAAGGSPTNPHPHTGIVYMLQGRPIMWKSRKQTRVARSINRAELLAVEEGLDTTCSILPFLVAIWRRVECLIHTDSNGVLKMLDSSSPHPTEKALRQQILEVGGKLCVVPAIAVMQGLEENKIHITHIKSAENVSDPLTKSMDTDILTRSLLRTSHASYPNSQVNPMSVLSPPYSDDEEEFEQKTFVPPTALRPRVTSSKVSTTTHGAAAASSAGPSSSVPAVQIAPASTASQAPIPQSTPTDSQHLSVTPTHRIPRSLTPVAERRSPTPPRTRSYSEDQSPAPGDCSSDSQFHTPTAGITPVHPNVSNWRDTGRLRTKPKFDYKTLRRNLNF